MRKLDAEKTAELLKAEILRVASERPEDPVAMVQVRGAELIAQLTVFFIQEVDRVVDNPRGGYDMIHGLAAVVANPLVNVMRRSQNPEAMVAEFLSALANDLDPKRNTREGVQWSTINGAVKEVGDA